MLLRVTEDMARKVRALAEIQHRQIQDQIRHLIEVGLEHELTNAAKETVVERRPLLSTAVNFEEKKGAA